MRRDGYLNPRQFYAEELARVVPSLRDLLRQHCVRAAYLFGSVVNPAVGLPGDLDIAVLPPVGLEDWLDYYTQLHGALCRLLEADNIDLVLLDRAPLSLQARVVVEGIRILHEDGAAVWEEQVLTRYADLDGWRRENWDAVRQWALRGVAGEIRMIERARVERFVFLIRDAVRELRALGLEEIGLEAYLQNKRYRALSEHYLRIAIEASLDLGRHVIVRTGLGVPQEYREIGEILRERGVVSADLGRKLEAMAGLRNVLVHLYWDIDYERLYKIIVEELDFFEQYVQAIFRYLDSLG